MPTRNLQTLFLPLALAAGFLSAVADRFGFWGQIRKSSVAWGDMTHFLPCVGKINPWLPGALIPAVG